MREGNAGRRGEGWPVPIQWGARVLTSGEQEEERAEDAGVETRLAGREREIQRSARIEYHL